MKDETAISTYNSNDTGNNFISLSAKNLIHIDCLQVQYQEAVWDIAQKRCTCKHPLYKHDMCNIKS